jgi:hypothetical protein
MAFMNNDGFRINKQLKYDTMNKLLKFAVIITVAGMFFSCDDMMDVHQKYLEGGEKIYAPKVDSLVFYNGKGRVQLWFWLLEAPNVRSVDIFWNSYADSLIVPITPSAGLDSMSVYIPLKDEKAYAFYVRTTDIFGNHSLSQMGSATVYDSIYASTLGNRGVRSASIKITDANVNTEIQWYAAVDDYVYSEIRYTDVNNKVKTVQVLANDRNTSISDAKGSSTYEYRTLYLPSNSIDTFYIAWEALEFITVESTPFKGPHILSATAPCTIEARNFDYGGEGIAFHDVSNRTPNSAYRTAEGDELSKTVDIEAGGNLGYVGVGEWLVYTVEVQNAGVYAADVQLSVNSSAGGSFSFSADGSKSATVTAPNQSSWSSWIWVFDQYPDLTQPTFRLSAGKHKIRFTAEGGGFNLMAYRLTRKGD